MDEGRPAGCGGEWWGWEVVSAILGVSVHPKDREMTKLCIEGCSGREMGREGAWKETDCGRGDEGMGQARPMDQVVNWNQWLQAEENDKKQNRVV